MSKYFIEWWAKDEPQTKIQIKKILINTLDKDPTYTHKTIIQPFTTNYINRVEEEIINIMGPYEGFQVELTNTYIYDKFLLLNAKVPNELTEARKKLVKNLQTITSLGQNTLDELVNIPFHLTLDVDSNIEQLKKKKKKVDTYIQENNSLPIISNFDKITILIKEGPRKYQLHKVYDMKTKEFIDRETRLQQLENYS